MTEAISLSEHNEEWAIRFKSEADRLKAMLGDACIRIHHVGSTAVPGLAAKPIIDIALECAVYPPSSYIITLMDTLGYKERGEGSVPGRHWFSKGIPRAFHVHLVPEQGEVALLQIAFRDFLKKNPKARQEYEVLKREAILGRGVESAEYALAKSPFIQKYWRNISQFIPKHFQKTPADCS